MPVNYTNGQCNAIKPNGVRCLNNCNKDSIFCGSHQNWQGKVFTPANSETLQAQAQSFADQSEETKTVIRHAVEQLEGKDTLSCPTCESSKFIINGVCVPCAEFYSEEESTMASYNRSTKEEDRIRAQADPERAWEAEVQHQYEATIEEPKNKLYVTVSGHRPNKLGGYNFNNPIRTYIRAEFGRVLTKLQSENPDKEIIVITGGAIGVDQDFARVAHDMGIKFMVYIPFKGQELKWPQQAQQSYHRMLDMAWMTKLITNKTGAELGYKGIAKALNDRNNAMADDGDVYIAAWNGDKSGGTANFLRYGYNNHRDKMIVTINPDPEEGTKLGWKRVYDALFNRGN